MSASICRCSHSVKHFKVVMNKGKIIFGQEEFEDVESFISHFDNCPLVGDDTGQNSMLTTQ